MAGVWTHLLSRAAWNVEYRWRAAKNNLIVLKFKLYLPKDTKNRKLWGVRETSLDELSEYLLIIEFRFGAML